MSNLHQQVNELTALQIDNERIERLKRKQQPKTKVQRMKGFFTILFITGFLCQLLSALLASSGVLHYVNDKLNGNGLIISMISICILLLIEGSKRFTLESYHSQRLDDEEINRITYVCILFLGCLSVGSTYYGTPYAVQYFAAAPTLVSIDSIEDNYNNKLAHQVSILEKEIKTCEATALAIDSASSWRGRISREARPAYLDAITSKKQIEAKLSAVAFSSSKDKFDAIQKAKEENEGIQNNHIRWCMSFGASLAIISILLELLFFICMFWCENYKRLEVKEAEAISQLKESIPKDKGNVKVKDIVNQPPASIQISSPVSFSKRKEGDIVPGTGKKKDRIIVEVNGELREYTKGKLKNLRNAQTGVERIKHLDHLLKKLTDA